MTIEPIVERAIQILAKKEYRELRPDEPVLEGDEFFDHKSRGVWRKSNNWRIAGKQTEGYKYRRPI